MPDAVAVAIAVAAVVTVAAIGGLKLVLPGLVVSESYPIIGATRDFEVGKYGVVEVKSYKRFEKVKKWLDQLAIGAQLFVFNSESGPRRRYALRH